jgi:hypothetical protein
MPELEQPEGGKEPDRAPEGSALPEGAAVASEPAANPVRHKDLPPFRGQSTAAPNLDLLVDMDEPEEIVFALKAIASKRPGKIWAALYEHLGRLEVALEKLNQP